MTEALLAVQWLALAARDLTAAETLAVQAKELGAEVCFHCQQCAEKAIKAAIVHQQGELLRTHSLAALLDSAAAAGMEIPVYLQAASELTPYAVEFRYAAPEEIQTLDVEQALAIAAGVLAWARALVKG